MKRFFIVTSVLVCTFASAQDKAPVPQQSSLDAAERLVKDIFKGDYSKAKTTVEKVALAKKLLEQGESTGSFSLAPSNPWQKPEGKWT